MYQVDLIKGEIPKQREVNKTEMKMYSSELRHNKKLQICKIEIVGVLRYMAHW